MHLRIPFALALAFCAPIAAASAPQSASSGRVIVLGFDGADARTTAELMDKGELPNLAALRERGTFAPLETTNPAESPVSWAALNCGQNPAKTGVPGFIRRELLDYSETRTKRHPQLPSATFGHLVGPESADITSLSGAPVPTWNPDVLGAALGAGTFVLFLGLFLLLRMRPWLALALAALLGGASFLGGRVLRGYLPAKIPVWGNPLEAAPFWETAAKAGVPCVVLDAAQAFDRAPVDNARVLAGLGVPDARGTINSFFVYTSSEERLYRAAQGGEETSSGGMVFRIDKGANGYDSLLPGPVNFWITDRLQAELADVEHQLDDTNLRYKRSQELQSRRKEIEDALGDAKGVPVPVSIVPKGDRADVTLGQETQTLGVGAWSDWYHLTFELNPLLKVKALARAKLLDLGDPNVELYVDALQYDPANPPFWQPISQPADFAQELAHACGPFETVGWACMNLPLKDAVIDPVSFMQDIEFTATWRAKMTYQALAQDGWRVLMSCESTPDRVQHMMYQHYDAGHPLHSAEQAGQTMTFFGQQIALRDAIPASYRSMDAMVGEVVQKHLREGDTLIVCSDHGFQSFRHQVHLNNWLHEKGYLALRTPPEGPRDPASALKYYVDWSKTRAYALGLGMVYVNQQGREGEGIVPPAEARGVLDAIARDFLASTDEKNGGAKIGAGAYVMSDIHAGPFMDREADMLLCFSPGYRVSWLTSGGGISGEVDAEGRIVPLPTIVPNNKSWSGDHVTVDPSLVRGIFFSNRKLASAPERISLLQIAPTILKLVGVEPPKEYDQQALEFAR